MVCKIHRGAEGSGRENDWLLMNRQGRSLALVRAIRADFLIDKNKDDMISIRLYDMSGPEYLDMMDLRFRRFLHDQEYFRRNRPK